ncbi:MULTISPECIES: glycosyltransferase [Exiguobacterium]|uniref:Glycosyltransferase n=1 Tax=Exiguobacterium acetylicum TaxID=41170 RepID=A0ABX8G986_EXIAC|nr:MULTISPECIES: glycosyltransferase [Exiguobacterium]KNH34765.1 hypothetical protein ACS74_09690 [Exiguobacterium acetylicum]QWB29742.1 glycosyltransferase [Exiguobacterium acetylicum]
MNNVLYIGDFRGGSGPSIVDLSLKNELNSVRNIEFIQIDKNLKRLFRDIKKFDHLHFSGLSTKGIIYALIFKVFNKKVSHTSHGAVRFLDINNIKQSKIKLIKEFVSFFISNSIIAVSDSYKEVIKETYPQFAPKIKFINNGGSNFSGEKIINFNSNKLSIVTFGGDRVEKGTYELYKTIKKFIIDNEFFNGEVELHIIGDISDISKFDSSIVTLHGEIPQVEVIKVLGFCNLYVQNSFYETFCMSALEAVELNLPVLLKASIGLPVILNERFKFNNVNELLNILDEIMQAKVKEQVLILPDLSWDNSSRNYMKMWRIDNEKT